MYRLVMHVNHASHASLKNQYVHASNLGTNVFKSDVLKNVFILSKHGTKANIKAIGRQMGYHYNVVSRLVRKHTQTNNVKDLPRSGRPR